LHKVREVGTKVGIRSEDSGKSRWPVLSCEMPGRQTSFLGDALIRHSIAIQRQLFSTL
jgi:hypothetical protein